MRNKYLSLCIQVSPKFWAIVLRYFLNQKWMAEGPAVLIVSLIDSSHHGIPQKGWRLVARSTLTEGEAAILAPYLIHFCPNCNVVIEFFRRFW